MPRRLLVHVFEDRFQARGRRFFGRGDRSAETLIDVGDVRELRTIIPKFATLEVLASEREWVAFGPGLQVVRRAVAIRIVVRGVTTHAVGHRLDQRRAEALLAAAHRFTDYAHHRKDVVAIHAHTRDAVSRGLLGEGAGRSLTL